MNSVTPTKPRVLIFSTAYLPFVGGAEVAIKEITDRLTDYEWVMITARMQKSLAKVEMIGNVTVYRIGFGYSIDKFILMFFGARFAARLNRKISFNATWAMMASYGGFAAARFKKNHSTVAYLLTLQEGDDLVVVEKKVRWIRSWFESIFTQADTIQAISHYLADWAKSFKPTASILVIPNGVDIKRYSGELVSDPTRSDKVIITASRLVVKNGIEDLIRALTLLPHDVVLQIAGDGPLRPQLEHLTKILGVDNRVTFLGSVSQADLPDKLRGADIFCRPSLSEGQGIAFLEAMAVGLPTIGTPVGGIPDFLYGSTTLTTSGSLSEAGSNQTGWIVPVHDPIAIADAVRSIIDPANQSEVKEITDRAKTLIQSDYNWTVLAAKMSAMIGALCRPNP